jgi:hypothetical protein
MILENKTTILEDVKINMKLKLSALWAVLMFLYMYADFFFLFQPGAIQTMMEGKLGPFPVTQGSLLQAAILMMIPSVMVFLSLILKPKVNYWTNITIGILYFAVSGANLIGETWIYYILFGIIEMIISLLIIWYAWRWPKQSS